MQSENKQRVGIIGGGIMGVTLAYRLSQRGYDVTLYERGSQLGGLASYFMYDGQRIDRFYHTILSSDMSMHGLIQESGVGEKVHFTATKQGFYDKGKIYPFNTPVDLMSFPPLSLIQRFRLGLQIIYAQFESDWRTIDRIPVQDWLMKVSGRKVYDKVWQPLLRAKFDTLSGDVPATYIWSRLKRMMGTRQGVTSKEMMSYLEDGYYTLIEALEKHCLERGVVFKLNTAIDKLEIENGKVSGVRLADSSVDPQDMVISTLHSPGLAALLPDEFADFKAKLAKQEYLGVLCPLVTMDRKLTPYYVINITDASIPFTAVVETTNLVDPTHVKNNHLVYLPKYVAPDNEMMQWPDEQVRTEWMRTFKQMFPDVQDSWIKDFIVQRARYVEPIRPINTLDDIPDIVTPINGLYMGNTVMIYPDLGNGEAVTRFADRIIATIP